MDYHWDSNDLDFIKIFRNRKIFKDGINIEKTCNNIYKNETEIYNSIKIYIKEYL